MGKVKVQSRHCRRLGENITGQDKFRKILSKRSYPPGLHGQKGQPRLSEYGVQLREKQKMRYTYGLRDGQLHKYFQKASSNRGNTGSELLRLLELRLDNVVYRMGIGSTRSQARQIVNHRHIMVNGRYVNIPSFQVKPGDVVEIRKKSLESPTIKQNIARNYEAPDWVDFDSASGRGQVIVLPEGKNLELGFNTQLVIEFYAR